jgi:hypothetical protein
METIPMIPRTISCPVAMVPPFVVIVEVFANPKRNQIYDLANYTINIYFCLLPKSLILKNFGRTATNYFAFHPRPNFL